MAIDIEMWSRLLRRMSYNYSVYDGNKEELKDIAIISAYRKRLINIPDNDKVLEMFYDSVTNTYDIDGISVYLMDRGDILIDKELAVENINGKDTIVSSEYSDEELDKRREQLFYTLLRSGIGIVRMDNNWVENIEDKINKSVFAVNLNNNSDFLKRISKLSECFNQDYFYFKPAYDNEMFAIGTNSKDYGNIINTGEFKINPKAVYTIRFNDEDIHYDVSCVIKQLSCQTSRYIAENDKRTRNDAIVSNRRLATITDCNIHRRCVISSMSTPIKYYENNKKWDWLDELSNKVNLSDDVEYLRSKFIFNSSDDFTNKMYRQNGCTQEFLDKYYNGDIIQWIKDNKTNENCFNCWNCVECKDCNNCTECYRCKTCSNCQNCDRCKKSIDCNKCTKCEKCERCENLEKLYMYHDNAKYIY